MQMLLISTLAAALLTGVSLAQSPAQSNSESKPQSTTMQLAPGSILRVELAKTIDAKKAKVGDEVIAKTMDDFRSNKNEVLAPAGSKVLGHVVEVAPHQDHSASTLGIAFDKIVLKDGAEMPLKASVQAIGWPESSTASLNDTRNTNDSPGGMVALPSNGRVGNGTSAPTPGINTPGNATTGSTSPEATSAPAAAGRLTPNAQGVIGMSGVSLSTGAAQDSLLTSQKHNVKLDSGTQMILRVVQ